MIFKALPDADLHLVGGTVRDILANREERHSATDLDLASRLPPDAAAATLERHGHHVVKTGLRHGTITVVFPGCHVELTTFRKSGTETSAFADAIETDLLARDFTINAIAYSLADRELVYPVGALEDLRRGLLRAVPPAPVRFQEDPLRMLRLVRFGPAQGRSIEQDTLDAARDAAPLIEQVSPERIREELLKILLSDFPVESIELMQRLSLLEQILPELTVCQGVEQNEFHIHDVYEHTLWVVGRASANELVRLAALFHDLGKPAALTVDEAGRRHFYRHEQISAELSEQILERLRFPKRTVREVRTLVRQHMRPLDCGPAGVRRLMRDLDGLLEEWIELKKADAPPKMPASEFQAALNNFQAMLQAEQARREKAQNRSLAVNGHDLIELGIPEGKGLGDILRALEELTIEDPATNTREHLLAEARRLYTKQQGSL